MIISGLKQVSNADTYLRLVVEELRQLWEDGVQVEDMLRESEDGRYFNLRVILLWIMYGYSGYIFISKM